MVVPWGGGINQGDPSGRDDVDRRPSRRRLADRPSILAVSLTVLMLLSLPAVSTVGALGGGHGSASVVGDTPPVTESANAEHPGDNGNGAGSNDGHTPESANGDTTSGAGDGGGSSSSKGGGSADDRDTDSNEGSGANSNADHDTASRSDASRGSSPDSDPATGSDADPDSNTESDSTAESSPNTDSNGEAKSHTGADPSGKPNTKSDEDSKPAPTQNSNADSSAGSARGGNTGTSAGDPNDTETRGNRGEGTDGNPPVNPTRGPSTGDAPGNDRGGSPADPPQRSNRAGGDQDTADDSPPGNGPTVEVTVGPPDDRGQRSATGPESPPGRSDGSQPTRVVSVSVSEVDAGESVDVDVSPPTVEGDDVALDEVSATVKRDGDFSLTITSSRDRLPGSPEFAPEDDADALGRIRLGHSITNEDVEEVSYGFRVSKDRLRATDTDPEDVALYRHADGSWEALPTDVVGETRGHYLLRSESPGMSEFAIGAKRPSFDTWWVDVSDASISAGESATVSARVTNVGGADGVYEASLEVDGDVVEERRITVAAGGTRQVNFERTFERGGSYDVAINEVEADDVTVTSPTEAVDSEARDRAKTTGIDRVLDLGRSILTRPPP